MMRGAARLVGLALSGLLFSACVSSSDQSLAACYDLSVGQWTPEVVPGNSLYVAPPPRIKLDSTRIYPEDGRVRFALHPAPGALPSIHGRAWWEEIEPDSIRLVWVNMSGVELRLERSRGSLSGIARAIWDFKEVREEASVQAQQVDCNAPLAESAQLRYRYPRGIATVLGDSLRLGDLAPDGWEVSDQTAAPLVGTPRLLPPFADANQVLLYSSPERGIYQIRIRFPSSYDHAEVRKTLSQALGAPTSDSEDIGEEGFYAGKTMKHTSWDGRLVRIWIMTSSDDEAVEVIMADG